ncbi:hypothetical protein BO70DRAFT_331486 [Aspergillus heteromorphus CBS 117.55]|uniref:ubiquitinyl hydrolase 1 n=1 Tax=Aspergillus heteromorphus CBS 117.55 TaxID=1448321 RepID=A0A317WSR8_9EURO|nr:uncharacterized protein BO70DRAFT_331486 [Aspergillus heteromorphus CBS 117.55]PWY88227.1 hypothetical protein BO70DRAFT_331486 [Aspergillus heteromorphus CBS 117.55]
MVYSHLEERVFDHVVLGPQLPGRHDAEIVHVEGNLLARMLNASDIMSQLEPESETWKSVRESLIACQEVHVDGRVVGENLVLALQELVCKRLIILHIAEQNAGLLIRIDESGDNERVVFEAFEASPGAAKVLASKNALICDFPSAAAAMPLSTFQDRSFLDSMSAFVEQASVEPIEQFAAKSRKAGVELVEIRDTADPALICDMLIALVGALGEPVDPCPLRKRVRDEVYWKKSERCWRRSAFWLVLRVGIQRLLAFSSSPAEGCLRYKSLQCVLLAHLLNDSLGIVSVEKSHLLKAKLCRRLTKLDAQWGETKDKDRKLFDAVGNFCEGMIQTALQHIDGEWNRFKRKVERLIPALPLRANQDNLNLALPNSLAYLEQVLKRHRGQNMKQRKPASLEHPLADRMAKATVTGFQAFAGKYHSLFEEEERLQQLRPLNGGNGLSQAVIHYLDLGPLDAYDCDLEQKSLMVLAIFEAWAEADRSAIHEYPLLEDYHPLFRPEILDVLHLSRLGDMERLQKVQEYLDGRQRQCRFPHLTIFSDPGKDCLAVRFFDSIHGGPLQKLRSKIIEASSAQRAWKRSEFKKRYRKYEELTSQILPLSCCCIRKRGIARDSSSCEVCPLKRQRKKLRMTVHEDFLPACDTPEHTAEEKAILFELSMPQSFAIYRDATWKIASTLGVPSPSRWMSQDRAKMLLTSYDQLREFDQTSPKRTVQLASTSKSFLVAHYKGVPFPTSESQVLLPFGLSLFYYDSTNQVWCKSLNSELTFSHHFGLPPSIQALLGIQEAERPKFAPDADGPSSYEITASQTRCPPRVTVHEFMACQSILSGKHTRWFSILRELGSSNINFSTEETTHIFKYLCLQAGPRGSDVQTRMTHIPLRDGWFCDKLLTQVERHLHGVSSNWREPYYMDTLLTIILRVCSIGEEKSASKARELLGRVQSIMIKWIEMVRTEIQGSTTNKSTAKLSSYAAMAALICKRTFYSPGDGHDHRGVRSLQAFIEASITLQDSLPRDPSELSRHLRGMLIRDTRESHNIRNWLRDEIISAPSSLEAAIGHVWPEAAECSREYSTWLALPGRHAWWLACQVEATNFTASQTVHYHVLEGHLLIDNKPLGRLPDDIHALPTVQSLFGQQPLLAYPSALPNMAYRLSTLYNGHEIHIGMRNGGPVILARIRGSLLEFVDSGIFRQGSIFDLPNPLIEDCVHWLNLRTKELDIRTRPHMWKFNREGNWVLNIKERKAVRRTVSLVDPQSILFQAVAGIFKDFEDAEHITVFQPSLRNLCVELKRMNLDFEVNKDGLLSSKQLHCEISPSQDAGTWYGLESMLVLRHTHNSLRRSVIVPLGLPEYHRNGPHVSVRIVGTDGAYARFGVDDILGRIQCAAEPILLFMKTLLHAYTSFVLPDPLTKRTGREEALAYLSSAALQPWTALRTEKLHPLLALARLSPKREYYPKHLKVQQMVTWDLNATISMQDDEFRIKVEDILKKLQRLGIFHDQTFVPPDLEPDILHLRSRALARRRCYERESICFEQLGRPADMENTQHEAFGAEGVRRVYEIVRLLRTRPSSVHTTRSLAAHLMVPLINGYEQDLSRPLLTETLKMDIAMQWGPLLRSCCRQFHQPRLHYEPMFLLAVMAFGSCNVQLLRALAALLYFLDVRAVKLPKCSNYVNFNGHELPTMQWAVNLIQSSQPEDDSNNTESDGEKGGLEATIHALAKGITLQWPCDHDDLDMTGFSDLPDPKKATAVVKTEWDRISRNCILARHLVALQDILDERWADKNQDIVPPVAAGGARMSGSQGKPFILPCLAKNLLSKIGPTPSSQKEMWSGLQTVSPYQEQQAIDQEHVSNKGRSSRPELGELESILHNMLGSPSAIRKQYAADLLTSLEALYEQDKEAPQARPTSQRGYDLVLAAKCAEDQYNAILNTLAEGDAHYRWLHPGQLWPCLSPVSLLQSLRSTANISFGIRMKDAILNYALKVTQLQHYLRMEDALKKGDMHRFEEEQQNSGHTNWKPHEHPDWLLLEIDADILIRPGQIDVAQATIMPTSGLNSVLQMNMGQGKTSVIMVLVAIALANGKSIARLVVPRALLSQTAQIFQARLGGLVGREILHVPFSRKTPIEGTLIQTYRDLHEAIRSISGVVLTQPDHVLSFRLGGLQATCDGHLESAKIMTSMQSWLDCLSRDVIDECDFALAVKTQLIYPSGTQLAVDGHPHRWTVPQVLLGVLEGYLQELQESHPLSLDLVFRNSGGFPFIHILRPDIEHALSQRIVDEICSGSLAILPPVSEDARDWIRRYLSEAKLPEEVASSACQAFPSQSPALHILRILRGLLVHGILVLCLKKRWNVQYGLHPGRDPVAVPFHAKGIPSEQAEWGHPDVAIVLTCLAFYYNGLTVDQLRNALRRLLRSDDPSSEYGRWTHRSASLPMGLRRWNLINVDDDAHVQEIWKHLRFEQVVINDYLNRSVFPVHARQFESKLQASGWDIPAFNQESSGQVSLTTGFSGTNDNKRLLPLTIRQDDLPALSHTNAEVLAYLLERRNRKYTVTAGPNGKRLSETQFLQKLKAAGIRILIDAGAHILESDNEGLVRQWLAIDPDAPAAVYFNTDDRASLIYRNGKEVPLLASPFAEDLSKCLVYFDEAHTRGTDLKFPPSARGALTLSLGQTKDHTVQAAMRLRQLGKSQSVMFVASPEAHQSIIDHRDKSSEHGLDSSDVVRWLLEQTCRGNEQLRPLYIAQGFDFCKRQSAKSSHPLFLSNDKARSCYVNSLLHGEQQTLEQLYHPRTSPPISCTPPSGSGNQIKDFWRELKMQQADQTSTALTSNSAFEEVEQEREVAFQVEEMRQAQEPRHFPVYSFPGLGQGLLDFARTGWVGADGWYERLFSALQRIKICRRNKVPVRESDVLLSTEFMKTIREEENTWREDFLRPVHWILWSPRAGKAIVIIPEEAEALIPVLRTIDSPQTYLILYAPPISKQMLHFNTFRYHTIPRLDSEIPSGVKLDLSILAGRLYFEFGEYKAILRYLDPPTTSFSAKSTSSGRSRRHKIKISTRLPRRFLEEWFAVARKGQDFTYTPMGYVCQNRGLRADHPFFAREGVEDAEADELGLDDQNGKELVLKSE